MQLRAYTVHFRHPVYHPFGGDSVGSWIHDIWRDAYGVVIGSYTRNSASVGGVVVRLTRRHTYPHYPDCDP